MKTLMLILLLAIFKWKESMGDFDPLQITLKWIESMEGPGQPHIQTLSNLYGPPCDCSGGHKPHLPSHCLAKTDCGDEVACIEASDDQRSQWVCVTKPKFIIANDTCPIDCNYVGQMHSKCYPQFLECHRDDKAFFVAVPFMQDRGDKGEASCLAPIGQPACWPQLAPLHIADGGPTDLVKELLTEEKMRALVPKVAYHSPPKPGLHLNPQTLEILTATHNALNRTNPLLAKDCWLCLALGISWPLAIPPLNRTGSTLYHVSCIFSIPFKVQPVNFNTTPCFHSPGKNNSFDIDVGEVSFARCDRIVNVTGPICLGPDKVFVCGNNMAYLALPQNWTGLCAPAALLPDINILPGDEPVPLPSFDTFNPRVRRAFPFIPILVGLGITGGLASGLTGVGMSVHVSQQVSQDIQVVYESMKDIQDQVDSLAEVVLQNRRGLDLLTADKGGLCLTLQERCCFYANKSGIVRDRIRKHQEELEKRRRELFQNPVWTAWGGMLPYLLPLLGPLISVLLIVSFGPCIVNRITQFVRQQIDSLLAKPIQVHYHRLDLADQGYDEPIAD